MSTRFRLTRRAFLLGSAALGGAALISGCGLLPGQQTGTLPDIPRNLPLEKQSFTVAISPGSQTFWRYIAYNNEKLIKPLGYDVKFVNLESNDDLEKGYLDNQYDSIVVPATLVPHLVDKGTDTQFFLPIAWIRQGYVLAVKKDSAVKSVADLKGKAVLGPDATDPAFIYWPALTLKNYQFDLVKDTKYTSSSDLNNMVQQLNMGQVDAIALSGTYWGQLASSPDFRLLSDLKQEWDKASGQPKDTTHLLLLGGYVARPSFIKQNQRFVEDLIRVHYNILKQYQNKTDKQKMLSEIASYNGAGAPQMDAGLSDYLGWYLGMDDAAPRRVYIDNQDVRDYQLMYSLLKNSGYLTAVPQSVDNLFYQSTYHPT